MKRRDAIKIGLLAGGAGVLAPDSARAQDANEDLLKYLCPPDGFPDELTYVPSPPAATFEAPLFVPPIMTPVDTLTPPPDPKAHQHYDEFLPKNLYQIHQREFRWPYHTDPIYTAMGGSVSWGFGAENTQWLQAGQEWIDAHQAAGSWSPQGGPWTPGPFYRETYGDPVLVRMVNDLPPVGVSRATFALPSTSIHLHNGHTASESDGNPQDWIDSGEFWDHHYGNFPSGFDPREKLSTLWYHDHRLDFTASNVYAGLSGFYCLFDEYDTGDETTGWRLPSGEYDIPLMLHDVMFKVANYNGVEQAEADFSTFNTDGWLGDQITVNRTIRPYLTVKKRQYRFRIVNGGPSRFYQLFLKQIDPDTWEPVKDLKFNVFTGDGNFLPEPVQAESIYLSTAQRVDIIIDFSEFENGDEIAILNLLEQTNGRGPSGRMLAPDPAPDPNNQNQRYFKTGVMLFKVEGEAEDNSDPIDELLKKKYRELPAVDMSQVKFERYWSFDYDGGLWTINGKVMGPFRVDAGIEQGTAEIWTFKNAGNDWSHPIHNHFTEFIILEINGEKVYPDFYHSTDQRVKDVKGRVETIEVFMGGPRRDVATLLPNDEIKVYAKWNDFLGKHVMHCHNVVHEDHAMMIRWDIVEPGKGFVGSRAVTEVYKQGTPYPDPRPPSPPHLEERSAQAKDVESGENE